MSGRRIVTAFSAIIFAVATVHAWLTDTPFGLTLIYGTATAAFFALAVGFRRRP